MPSGESTTSDKAELEHGGMLEERIFGRQCAYGLAEGAALNTLEPWQMAAAVGRDVGNFLMGSVGMTPSQARPGEDESNVEHSAGNVMNRKLEVLAIHPSTILIFEYFSACDSAS